MVPALRKQPGTVVTTCVRGSDMTDRTCSVEGCERKPLARGLCKAHYARAARNDGDPGPALIGPPVNLVRVPREGCAVAHCDRPHKTNGYCGMHYQRWRKWGDPLFVGEQIGPTHPAWKGDEASYLALHHRIERLRGKASEFVCPCGEPAREWAYDHTDPDERRGSHGSSDDLAYSLNPDHYSPMCAACHRRFDTDHRYVEEQDQ